MKKFYENSGHKPLGNIILKTDLKLIPKFIVRLQSLTKFCRLFPVLAQYLFHKSKTKLDYYHGMNVQVLLHNAKRHKIYDLSKLANFK